MLLPEQYLTAEEIAGSIEILGPHTQDGLTDGDVVFVMPDGKRYRAHNIIKPHGKDETIVSLIAEEAD